LGKALNLEFSAVQQHSTQARLVAAWGLGEAAASLSKEAENWLQHVNRIFDRMLELGIDPTTPKYD